MPEYHAPVLGEEVSRFAQDRKRVVDCTVGDGGHTRLFLEAGARVLAVDRDPDALRVARGRLDDGRIQWLGGSFASPDVLAAVRDFKPDMVLLDLGVSSRQLDQDSRGFTFRPGVPLDMRMEVGRGETAAEVLNRRPQVELARIFRDYADERRARRLAGIVTRRRENRPLTTSDDFVNAIRAALGSRSGPGDFARLFQALRIEVNGELESLRIALPTLRDALVPGGTIAVISHHSGEDRAVKEAFAEWARSCVCPPRLPVCTCRGRALGELTIRKGVRATDSEVATNPRARSARLRGFRKANGC